METVNQIIPYDIIYHVSLFIKVKQDKVTWIQSCSSIELLEELLKRYSRKFKKTLYSQKIESNNKVILYSPMIKEFVYGIPYLWDETWQSKNYYDFSIVNTLPNLKIIKINNDDNFDSKLSMLTKKVNYIDINVECCNCNSCNKSLTNIINFITSMKKYLLLRASEFSNEKVIYGVYIYGDVNINGNIIKEIKLTCNPNFCEF